MNERKDFIKSELKEAVDFRKVFLNLSSNKNSDQNWDFFGNFWRVKIVFFRNFWKYLLVCILFRILLIVRFLGTILSSLLLGPLGSSSPSLYSFISFSTIIDEPDFWGIWKVFFHIFFIDYFLFLREKGTFGGVANSIDLFLNLIRFE